MLPGRSLWSTPSSRRNNHNFAKLTSSASTTSATRALSTSPNQGRRRSNLPDDAAPIQRPGARKLSRRHLPLSVEHVRSQRAGEDVLVATEPEIASQVRIACEDRGPAQGSR